MTFTTFSPPCCIFLRGMLRNKNEQKTIFSSVPLAELEDSIRHVVRQELDRKAVELKKQPKAYSRVAAAQLLGISPPTLDRHIRNGNIRATKMGATLVNVNGKQVERGGRVLIAQSELERFIKST